jgi:hypothetical protein
MDSILQKIVPHFKMAVRDARLTGIVSSSDIIQVVAENFGGKEVANGSYSFTVDRKEIIVFDTYSDEDNDELFDYDNNLLALGFCISYNSHLYCFDIDLTTNELNYVRKTVEKVEDPKFHIGKRSFNHHRSSKRLSMRNFNAVLGFDEHEVARNWVSGQRTLYHLVSIDD